MFHAEVLAGFRICRRNAAVGVLGLIRCLGFVLIRSRCRNAIRNALVNRAAAMGVKEVSVVVKGVGAGRESAIRAFATKGIHIGGIKDTTPVPHNGPRPPKARRV